MPKLKILFSVVFVLILTVFFFNACKKYVYNAFVFTPEIGIHLLKGNFYLSDLIKIENDSTISFYEDDNQLMHIVFERNIDTTTAYDFFNDFYENDTIINQLIPLEFVDDFYEITTDLNAKMAFDDQIDIYKIDSIRLDSCILMASLYADPNNFDSLAIEVPTFYDEHGNPVVLSFSSDDFQSNKSVNLPNGIIRMESAANSSGLVNIKLHMKFSKKGETSVKTPQLFMFLYNVEINTFYGRFGDRRDTLESEAPFIEPLPNLLNESVDLDIKEPEIYLYFKNGFNLPFNFKNLKLEAGNSWNRQTISGLPYLIRVPASKADGPGYGEEMVQSSTNLENIIGQFPERIFFYGETVLNPKDKETPNSISINDTMFMGIRGDLPMNVKVSEIYYQQIFDSLSVGDLVKNAAKSIKFRAEFANKLPVKLTAQIFFLDKYNIRFAEAFKEPLFIQPADSEIEQYFETELSNEFTGEILNKILESKIMMELKFQTFAGENNSMVEFLSTQNISFDVFAYAETYIESSDL